MHNLSRFNVILTIEQTKLTSPIASKFFSTCASSKRNSSFTIISRYEDMLIRKIAGLLYVDPKDSNEAKLKVLKSLDK